MPRKTKRETKRQSPTITLSKEQFDNLINEIKKLKEEVEVLRAKKEIAREQNIPKRPIYYSLSNIEELRQKREEELQAKVETKVEKAIDMILLDAKVNPPKRY